MKRFSKLVYDLDQKPSENIQMVLLTEYFMQEKNEKDKLWALALFIKERPSRVVNTTLLKVWAAESAGIPLWLFDENYKIVGDLTETISSILPIKSYTEDISLSVWIQRIMEVRTIEDEEKKSFVLQSWEIMDILDLWIFNKLITGGFRIKIKKNIVIHALSKVSGIESNIIAYNLIEKWSPWEISWNNLFKTNTALVHASKPYPFSLVQDFIEDSIMNIRPESWVAEWKWNGLRAQLIVRFGQVHLWSQGQELITDKFPEFQVLKDLPISFVLDGQIVAWDVDKPMDYFTLQSRIGRKITSKKLMQEIPVRYIACDVLEIDHTDVRQSPLSQRRVTLERIMRFIHLENLVFITPWLPFKDNTELRNYRDKAKNIRTEGLILKNIHSPYGVFGNTNDAWSWKIDPYNVVAVLIYAHRGRERNALSFSDFTFAVWYEKQLLPFTKAESGLTEMELKEITAWIKLNTIEKFGPVYSVNPQLVFEISFEGISPSSRHKSGISVKFPIINKWCKDKNPEEADTLDKIKSWII